MINVIKEIIKIQVTAVSNKNQGINNGATEAL
jgi:hypothetical protein